MEGKPLKAVIRAANKISDPNTIRPTRKRMSFMIGLSELPVAGEPVASGQWLVASKEEGDFSSLATGH
jgi:hypothetical protein